MKEPSAPTVAGPVKTVSPLSSVTVIAMVAPGLVAVGIFTFIFAWNDLLLANRVPGNAGTCETPLKQVHELAQKLGISGTPVVFFSNGRRLTGYAPPEHFGRMLSTHSKG